MNTGSGSRIEGAVFFVLVLLSACTGNGRAKEPLEEPASRSSEDAPPVLLEAPTTLTPAQRDAVASLWRGSHPQTAAVIPDDSFEEAWAARGCTYERGALARLFPDWTIDAESVSAIQVEIACAGTAQVRMFDARRRSAPWCTASLEVSPGTSRILLLRSSDPSRAGLVWTLPDGRSCLCDWTTPAFSVPAGRSGAGEELHAGYDWWMRERSGPERLLDLTSWNGEESGELARLLVDGFDGLNMRTRLTAETMRARGIDRPIEQWPEPVWAVTFALAVNGEH